MSEPGELDDFSLGLEGDPEPLPDSEPDEPILSQDENDTADDDEEYDEDE